MSKLDLASVQYPCEFWGILDQSKLHQDPRPANEVSLYPSESSARVVNGYKDSEIIGGCNRKAWFRNKLQRVQRDKPHQSTLVEDIVQTDFTPQTLWKFELGNATEDSITNESKRAEIWAENSRRFEWNIPMTEEDLEQYGQPLIRGEVDLTVFQEPGSQNKIGVEIKSITGYVGQKQVFGSKSRKTGTWIPGKEPSPKQSHLLQASLYAYVFCTLNEEYKYFKLAYLSRENGNRIEFDIDIIPEEDEAKGEVKHRVYVDQEPYFPTLYIEDVLDRYIQLHKMLIDDTLPPRDFSLQYSDSQIQKLYSRDLLTKKGKSDYEAGKEVKKGDWQCSYCAFKDMCYDSFGTPIDYIDRE